MRAKMIAVFTVVVLVVGVLSYALTRAALGGPSTKGDAQRSLSGAKAQLHVDALTLERWLDGQAADPRVREPFDIGTPNARGDAATSVANAVRDAAAKAPELAALALVALVDPRGIVVGRNGSALMRGDDLGAIYPALKVTLEKGITGSDVWISPARNEQLFASYAPIRASDGKIIGSLVVATALNDERLTQASNQTSGSMLMLAVPSPDGVQIIAKSAGTPAELIAAVQASPAKEAVLQSLASARSVDLGGIPVAFDAASHALDGYGDGKRAVLISALRSETPASGLLIWPALGSMLLGILLVVIGAYFLDAYISRPISDLEEGLLAIMNGRTEMRFEIEHAELGGLVFRLNSLLNQLLNVQEEEETDEQGHPAHAPTASSFKEALSVDERMASGSTADASEVRKLRAESDDDYYKRVFDEYISAKKSLGDPTDHITREAFIGRIMSSEREMAKKHGKPVRYKVEVRGKEVVLLAVPLA